MLKNIYITAFLFALASPLQAIPLDDPTVKTSHAELSWQILTADNALGIGLWGVAEKTYKDILARTDIDPNTRQYAGLRLASTLIAQSNSEDARQALASLPDRNTPTYRLRLAMIHHLENKNEAAQKFLKSIKPKELPNEDQAWYHITQGLLIQEKKSYKAAREHFEKAKELASSEGLKAEIDAHIFRGEIHEGKIDESVLRSIEKKISKAAGRTPVKTELIKQYALILQKLGRPNDAFKKLRNKVEQMPSHEFVDAQEIRLLMGMIAGPDSQEGSEALEQLLRLGGDPQTLEQALGLLVQSKINSDTERELESFLEGLMERQETLSVFDSILLARIHLLIEAREFEKAEVLAERFLEEYRDSRHMPQALHLLAYLSWSSNPPRYRLAADYLSQLKGLTVNSEEQLRLTRLEADAYFLNQDYQNAALLYKEILKTAPEATPTGEALFQWTLASLNSGKLSEAIVNLDQFSVHPGVDPINHWRAEWNLISAMKTHGQADAALTRVRLLIKNLPDAAMNLDLALRLMWLRAQLSMEAGEMAEVPGYVDHIFRLIEANPDKALDFERRNDILSQALLLKAQALLGDESTAVGGLSILENIRANYGDSRASILSYIVQARYYIQDNRTVDAQQMLINLSDKYPDSEFVPIALYEAAISAEARGLTATHQEALAILERLATDYPESPLVFYARLKQGDLLRKLNDFSGAQIVYEDLVNRHPSHHERYRVEMALADSQLAEAAKEGTRLKDVAQTYERLMDLPSVQTEIRIEAGYKAGFAFRQASDWTQAEQTLFTLLTRFLINRPEGEYLGTQGNYWLSRSVFELGGLLDRQGKSKQAHDIYALIEKYGLPGQELAQLKMQ